MASYMYYYFFSLILALGAVAYMANLIYLRTTGKVFMGPNTKPSSPEHKRVLKLASNRNIAIVAVLAVILVANAVNSVYAIARLHNPSAHFVLIFAPIAVILLSAVIFFKTRDIFTDTSKLKRR